MVDAMKKYEHVEVFFDDIDVLFLDHQDRSQNKKLEQAKFNFSNYVLMSYHNYFLFLNFQALDGFYSACFLKSNTIDGLKEAIEHNIGQLTELTGSVIFLMVKDNSVIL